MMDKLTNGDSVAQPIVYRCIYVKKTSMTISMDQLPIEVRWVKNFTLSMVANILPIHAFRNVCISISVNFTGGDVTGRCQCFQECDMTTYDLQISTAAFPSNFLLHEIKEQLNFSEKQIRLITLFFIGDKLNHPVSTPDYHIICKQKYVLGFQYQTKCILHTFIKSNLFFNKVFIIFTGI